MTTETILTDERIFALAAETDIASIDPKIDVLMFSRDEMLKAGRDIEQAVLQSPEIQALRKDAERYQLARRKVCIFGSQFHIINLAPRYVAPDAAIEFDSAIDDAKERKT